MQEEGKQLSRATFSVSVKNFKRSVGEGLQRDAHGLVEGDGAADGGGNNRAAAALDARADDARGLEIVLLKEAVREPCTLAASMAMVPLPQLPSQMRVPVSTTLTSGVMRWLVRSRKMTP